MWFARFLLILAHVATAKSARTALRDLRNQNGSSSKSSKKSKGKGSKVFDSAFDKLTSLLLDNECPPWTADLEDRCTDSDGTLVSPYGFTRPTLAFCCRDKLIEKLYLKEEDCRAPPTGQDCLAILPFQGVFVGFADTLQCCGEGTFFEIATPVSVEGDPDDSPADEGPEEAVDQDVNTKFLTFNTDSRLEADFGEPLEIVVYSITSANDNAERDPLNWELEGSNDGTTWVTLDSQVDIDFPDRFQPLSFQIANPTAYRYYALDAENNSGDIIQYAELSLFIEQTE